VRNVFEDQNQCGFDNGNGDNLFELWESSSGGQQVYSRKNEFVNLDFGSVVDLEVGQIFDSKDDFRSLTSMLVDQPWSCILSNDGCPVVNGEFERHPQGLVHVLKFGSIYQTIHAL